MVFMISPTSARVSSPSPSTTSTSPGASMPSARWTARLSPERVRTVRAGPTSRPDRWNARKPTAPGSRSRLSLMTEVGASRKLSRSERAGRGMLSIATVTVMVRSDLDIRRRQRATEQPGDRALQADLTVRQQPYQITASGGRSRTRAASYQQADEETMLRVERGRVGVRKVKDTKGP